MDIVAGFIVWGRLIFPIGHYFRQGSVIAISNLYRFTGIMAGSVKLFNYPVNIRMVCTAWNKRYGGFVFCGILYRHTTGGDTQSIK